MGRFETGSCVNTWKQIPLKWFVGVSAVFLLFILILGLRPKDFSFSGRVSWITDQAGIRFSKYGIAYTDPFIERAETNLPQANGFSIEIALKPASDHDKGFNFILALYNQKNSAQLVMGQWRSWIILMNGDDYAHKRRTKRITIDTAPLPPTTQLITVTTGPKGTKIYVGGQLIRSKKNFTLKIPAGPKSRLLLGNSVYNRHSWRERFTDWRFIDIPLRLRMPPGTLRDGLKPGNSRLPSRINRPCSISLMKTAAQAPSIIQVETTISKYRPGCRS